MGLLARKPCRGQVGTGQRSPKPGCGVWECCPPSRELSTPLSIPWFQHLEMGQSCLQTSGGAGGGSPGLLQFDLPLLLCCSEPGCFLGPFYASFHPGTIWGLPPSTMGSIHWALGAPFEGAARARGAPRPQLRARALQEGLTAWHESPRRKKTTLGRHKPEPGGQRRPLSWAASARGWAGSQRR